MITNDHLHAIVDGSEWNWLTLSTAADTIEAVHDVIDGKLPLTHVRGVGGGRGTITRERLAIGLIERCRSLDIDDELAQMDATDYDVIIQRASFGDVIYD